MKVMNLRSLNICSLSEEQARDMGTSKYLGDFSVYDMPDVIVNRMVLWSGFREYNIIE